MELQRAANRPVRAFRGSRAASAVPLRKPRLDCVDKPLGLGKRGLGLCLRGPSISAVRLLALPEERAEDAAGVRIDSTGTDDETLECRNDACMLRTGFPECLERCRCGVERRVVRPRDGLLGE